MITQLPALIIARTLYRRLQISLFKRGIGVQREMVRAILARTDFVAGYHDAPAEAGGRGATVVTLR